MFLVTQEDEESIAVKISGKMLRQVLGRKGEEYCKNDEKEFAIK